MRANPTLICSALFFYCAIGTQTVADPIGSLKSIKQFGQINNIAINEAPIPILDNNNNQNSTNLAKETPSQIARAQFTTAVVNREPTDDVVMLSSNTDKIFYFSELSNLKGHQISHRWLHQGKLMAEVTFAVKSDRWRVFSSKKIRPDWTGEWAVELVDEKGNALETTTLEIVAAGNL